MVGCVGNAPTLVRLDIRFTGGSRSLRGYQPEMVAGRGMRGAVAPTTTGRGALTAWTPERQSHHDRGAYETPLVLPLRRLRSMRSAFMELRYRAVRSTFPRFEMVDRHGFAPCFAAPAAMQLALRVCRLCASAHGVPACEASDLLNGRAARRKLVAGAGIEPAH